MRCHFPAQLQDMLQVNNTSDTTGVRDLTDQSKWDNFLR